MSAEGGTHCHPIVKKLIKLLGQKLSKKKAGFLATFVKQYYSSVSEADLTSQELVDLYGALLSHWELVEKRKPGEVNIRVFNPCFEKEGWQSTHTIIQISHDDMPFLVDSLLMALNRLGINIHVVFHAGGLRVVRDKKGHVVDLLEPGAPMDKRQICVEAPISMEIDRQTDSPKVLGRIQDHLLEVLRDVALVVNDFKPMKARLREAISTLQKETYAVDQAEIDESIDFLRWLDNDHFTFAGVGEFKLVRRGGKEQFELIPETALGLLTEQHFQNEGSFLEDLDQAEEAVMSASPLLISKSSYRSTVHRASHMDSVGIKHFNAKGKVVSETRFLGLYTSTAYHSSPRYIPFLRRKVELVLAKSGFSANGHDAKALLNVLENFPRDELFQISEEELFNISIGVLQIQERQHIRLFVRRDTYGRYYSCMVYVPRDIYNTELRIKMQNILLRAFNGLNCSYSPNFLPSVLCRIDFSITVDPSAEEPDVDVKAIESILVQAARDWRDELKEALVESKGEHRGSSLFTKYARAFPAGYREAFLVRSAVIDINHIEQLLAGKVLSMCFYRMLEEPEGYIRFKLFHKGSVLPLTEVLPILENMGLSVIEERPYEVRMMDDQVVWISDFGMWVEVGLTRPDEIGEVFQEAFAKVWSGEAENDGFNRLVMKAGLGWRDIMILRAYAKYLMQIGFHYSQSYIEDTLTEYPEVSAKLIDLYKIAFSPDYQDDNTANDIKRLEKQIFALLSKVANLDKDRILRRYVNLFQATVRTNYYQLDSEGRSKPYLSFKLMPGRVQDLPEPRPMFEIFVYSPRMEGVHLRGAKVARGGLRWSDRREDFRTEVLGLMKAQQVKNAVIVPLGAKGGFVAKQLKADMTREAFQAEGQDCYRIFIRGLLDLTDNRAGEEVVCPERVICFDEPDPYLVVAADKGTATFSDIANEVAAEYRFWLGDAFASGGSNGYDHKKMGITARGAWESVKRHFLEVGHNTQTEDFTVVGIGDMAGDVFGNGMLLSKHIRLVAAFNHMHIFIDPEPDAASGYAERQRLFDMPRSTWADYDAKLISKGGGIFERSAKEVPISPEMQHRFSIRAKALEPSQLIRALLTAEVDLLWNGGIGTYVKASYENDFDVGDRANDALRVDAADLRCRVVGEGGNLGLTQFGRIEFALNGGAINTDAIDNSAGVDCSDHEVNIKILLDKVVQAGDITVKQRNNLLNKMQEEVSELVLKNNYGQTQILSRLEMNSPKEIGNFNRLMRELETGGHLDRDIEFLPSEKTLKARKAAEIGLARPELAVLMAYAKTVIKRSLLDSKLPHEPYCQRYLQAEFPEVLHKRHGEFMQQHDLAHDIIATQLTNKMVQRMGITFVHRMYDETGAIPSMIAKAYIIVDDLCDIDSMWTAIEKLDGVVPAAVQYRMMNDVTKIARRLCRWFLRNRRGGLDIEAALAELRGRVEQMRALISKILFPEDRAYRKAKVDFYRDHDVPLRLAHDIADFQFLSPCLDIMEMADRSNLDLEELCRVYYALSDILGFAWFRGALLKKQELGYWEVLSASGMRDDLEKLQRIIANSVVLNTDKEQSVEARIQEWISSYQFLVDRWFNMLEGLKTSSQSMVRFMAAFRALLDLTQGATYGAKSYAHREVHLSL